MTETPVKTATLAKRVKDGAKGRDDFQTPPCALEPLLPYIGTRQVWEPACGQGYIVRELQRNGIPTIGTDVLTGDDFLTTDPPIGTEVIVTNPPYSLKTKFMARCYDLGLPFALLMPLTTFDSKARRDLMRRHGIEVLVLDDRIDFIHPERDLFAQDAKKGGAWYATAWWCWKMLPQQVVLQEPVQRRLL